MTLAYYGVPSDDEDYLRYVNGEPVPLSPHREPWYAQLRRERARPEARVVLTAGDFYIIDGHQIVLMRYAEDGTYLGAVGAGASSTQGYIALAGLAWEMSTPFTEWWALHPQYHRKVCAA